MNLTIIFISAITSLTALYFAYINLIQQRKLAVNKIFAIFCLIICAEYAIIALINSPFEIKYSVNLTKTAIFLPKVGLITLTMLILRYPIKKPNYWNPIIALMLLIIIGDAIFIYSTPLSIEAVNNFVLTTSNNIPLLIQAGINLLFIILIPTILIIRIKTTHFNKLKGNLKFYLYGIFCFYVFFISAYLPGISLNKISIIENPVLALPIIGIIVSTNHLVLKLKSSNFQYFYIDMLITIVASVIMFTPVFLFLKYENTIPSLKMISSLIKAIIFFIYFVLINKLFLPLRNLFIKKNYNSVLENINQIILPINDIKAQTNNDDFWDKMTQNSIEGIKDALQIPNANFMLYDKKNNGYHLSHGYGDKLNIDFIPKDSEIINTLSKIEGVFEKSYFLTDYKFSNSPNEVVDFFHENKINIVIVFKNISESIIGFLFLGELYHDKPFSSTHMDALEIYRIKIQKILTSGLILDEVTINQIKNHDKLVIRSVKKKIIPEKINSIPNIRISSMSIDNSDLGGDYFDSVKMSANKLSIFISDLSYSGIDSALLGIELYSIFHSRSFIFNSPEKMLNMMNQVIKASTITNKHAPSSAITIDSSGNFLYSNAAYNALLIYDTNVNKFIEIQTSSIPIGIKMDYKYQLTAGKLKDEAIGFLYSDGLISSCNTSGEPFSIDKVKDIIIKYAGENPAIILREIFNVYIEFTENINQTNDVSAILFKKVKPNDE